MRRPGLAVFVAAVLSSEGARAEVVARLFYEADQGCPDRAAFVSELRARTTELRESAASDHSFEVRLSSSRGGRARGVLLSTSKGAVTTTRTIEASSCADAARALSFVLALAIDPTAKTETEPDATPKKRESQPPDEPVPPSSREERPTDDARGPGVRRKEESVVLGASAHALGEGSLGLALGFGVSGEWRPAAWLGLRLGAFRTLAARLDVEGTSTTFAWTTARIEASLLLARTGAFSFRGGPLFDASLLEASGGGAARGTDEVRLASAIGGALRGELRFSRSFGMDISGGVLVPLVRDTFQYRPALRVYEVPKASFQGAVGALFFFR